MGKKGKRTKWQALPMEEETAAKTTTTASGTIGNGGAVGGGGYKKFRPFSTYNGKWGSIKRNPNSCSAVSIIIPWREGSGKYTHSRPSKS